MKTEEINTWYDLKRVVNEMTGGQLGMPVKVWGENWSATINEVDILDEDYVNPSGEGAEPASVYSKEELDGEPILYEKGQTILSGIKD